MQLCRSTMVLLVSMAQLCAQTATPSPSTPAQSWRIAGTVLSSVSAQPLPGIEVSISATEQRELAYQAITDGQGRFAFANVARGKYTLTAQGRGFAPQAYQQHGSYSTAIAVGPGLDSENIMFRLVQDASISGNVVDEENEAVRSGQVQLYRRSENGRTLQLQGDAPLDEQGHYHFPHLHPGTYLLAVLAQPWYAQDPQVPVKLQAADDASSPAPDGATEPASETPATSSSFDVAYPVTFYPGVSDAGNAAPIVVSPGERGLADVTLRPIPGLHLTIRSASSDPSRPTAVTVMQRVLDALGSGPVSAPVRSQSTRPGIISVSGLAPGHFVVELRSFDGKDWITQRKEMDLAADTEIDASEAAAGALNVEGTVSFPAGAAVPPRAYINFFDRRTGEAFGSEISAKGTFHIQQMPAGPSTMDVAVSGIADAAVRELVATGASVNGHALHLPRSGSVHIRVSLSKGLARVNGTVLEGDRPIAGAMVVLVPENAEGNIDLFRRDQSDSDGTFSLFGVVPGRYTLLAIQDGWDLDWQDSTLLRPYLDRGKAVEITTAHTYNVSIASQGKPGDSPPPSQP